MTHCSTRLEDKEGKLADIEVDETFGLMSNIRAKVLANDNVPGRMVFLVKLLLHISGNILLNVETFHSLNGTINSVLLHIFGHIGVLDSNLSVSHVFANS